MLSTGQQPEEAYWCTALYKEIMRKLLGGQTVLSEKNNCTFPKWLCMKMCTSKIAINLKDRSPEAGIQRTQFGDV